MNNSFEEKRDFLRPVKKNVDIEWENPFLLKHIFKNCEVRYEGRVRQPEKLFSEHELTHINLIYSGILFRLQKALKKTIPSQIQLLKDDQQTFTELYLEFIQGPTVRQLHEVIQRETQNLQKKYPQFQAKVYFKWRHDPALDKKSLSFQLRVLS
jgi:hypothetical protein